MTILIVENNPNDQKLAVLAFKQTQPQVEVLILGSGIDALDYLHGEEAHALPQLVLLDLKMPRISGLEVLRRIRQNARTLFMPVVIFSSSTEPEDMIQAYHFGANSYISKPMDFEKFIYMVEQLKIYWVELNQLPKFPGSRR